MFKTVVICLLFFSLNSHAAKFSLKISSVEKNKNMNNRFVFNSFGCNGENISPELTWSNPPKGTKSFAVTMYDPDAPTGSGWWHWTIVNIPLSAMTLQEGAGNDPAKLPPGAVQGRTDYGKAGYGGPCPPPGKPHRYIFTVYALKVEKLEIDENSSGALVGFNVNGNMIEKASFTGSYKR